ncbi:PspA/IM30 family protein [Streptomyces sp. WAC 00631]|uniref:PspA/IM30 family protein n=1 Tax=unclassified Streptomyces TaxID=2593676 RepID=UPI000F78026C|nr:MULTISPECIES: PspA/IM30 family protein [unclassified Streptomyces]MCC5032923.1 PspA/IM30 family protein [Streptomyces sp. WAC 00631]MCC9741010.1 PspA/IM30 family protein [Streptomyces sp. MNU89]
MPSIAQRVAGLFQVKANRALDRAEDPRETLDYSYQQQLELLQKVRRGLADVAAARKRVEQQADRLRQSAETLRDQAGQALAAGREDLAREALDRRTAAGSRLMELREEHASLQAQEEKLTLAAQRLQAKTDTFRTSKETIKARYTAAEAQSRVTEAVTGIGEEMGDVGLAVERARDRTEQLQARSAALDELMATGALEDAALPAGRDDLRAELDAVTAEGDVETELARMKTEIASSGGPAAVESGSAEERQDRGREDRQARDATAARESRRPPDQEAT